ncbi:hypothetical protein PCE1_000644 [Barthelona sp. PCE]
MSDTDALLSKLSQQLATLNSLSSATKQSNATILQTIKDSPANIKSRAQLKRASPVAPKRASPITKRSSPVSHKSPVSHPRNSNISPQPQRKMTPPRQSVSPIGEEKEFPRIQNIPKPTPVLQSKKPVNSPSPVHPSTIMHTSEREPIPVEPDMTMSNPLETGDPDFGLFPMTPQNGTTHAVQLSPAVIEQQAVLTEQRTDCISYIYMLKSQELVTEQEAVRSITLALEDDRLVTLWRSQVSQDPHLYVSILRNIISL